MWTVKNEVEDDTLKDEMAQQYKAIQSQHLQLPYQPTMANDPQLRKKSNSRSFKKFFVKLVLLLCLNVNLEPSMIFLYACLIQPFKAAKIQ